MTETASVEKPVLEMTENAGIKHDPLAPQAVHNETFDISPEALGTNLPPNYYYSPRFLGSVVVSYAVKVIVETKGLTQRCRHSPLGTWLRRQAGCSLRTS